MKTGGVLILIAWIWVAQAIAQQMQFEFKLYQGEGAVLDALQDRLLDGGQVAVDAMAKMPDLERSRRVKLVEELTLQTPKGQRAKGVTSQRMLKADDFGTAFVDGLLIEIDPEIDQNNAIDLNMFFELGRRDGRTVRVSRLSVAAAVQAEVPTLLMRWTEGDTDRVLIGTASTPGTPRLVPSGKTEMVYVETIFYASQADAKAKQDAQARILFPSVDGQRARGEDHVPLMFEPDPHAGQETANIGLNVEIDPAVDKQTGELSLAAALEFSEEGSGSERTASGGRVPRVEIHQGITSQQMMVGDVKTVPLQLQSLADRAGQPDDWLATVEYRLYAFGGGN